MLWAVDILGFRFCFCVFVLLLFVVFRELSFGVFLSVLTCFLEAKIALIVNSGVPDLINVCSN